MTNFSYLLLKGITLECRLFSSSFELTVASKKRHHHDTRLYYGISRYVTTDQVKAFYHLNQIFDEAISVFLLDLRPIELKNKDFR